jgi:hypothetical protein
MNRIDEVYQGLRATAAAELAHEQSRSRLFSMLRVVTFLLLAVCMVMGVRAAAAQGESAAWFLTTVGLLLVFLYLVRKQAVIEVSRLRADARHRAVEAELQALRGDFSAFDRGENSVADHAYAADLDVFGNDGLYQHLSRCSSAPGKAMMHQHLSAPAVPVHDWPKWHAALKRLAQAHHERFAFIAAAASSAGDTKSWAALKAWSNAGKTPIFEGRVVSVLLFLAPVYSAGVIAAYAFDRIGDSALMLAFLLPLTLSAVYFRASTQLYADLSKQTDFLKSLSFFIAAARALPTEEGLVAQAQSELQVAQEATADLGKILSAYDQRNNIFAAIITNAVYLADVRNARRATVWRVKYGAQVGGWIDALARLEVLVSLAQFTARHGEGLVYPEVLPVSGIRAAGLMHPLMLHKTMVPNDAELTVERQVALITGANMAGKSTYLRSLGLNILLAKMGAPVAATSFQMSDLRLFTSMRTTDSLATGTSYFMAELRRLSALVEAVPGDAPLLVLLDEILKGTNSSDKEAGSRAFVLKLLRMRVFTVVATHDVSLCTLASDHREVVNLHFSADVGQDDLHFDYRLKSGVCDTMNATWLMRKMGLIDDSPSLN